MEFFRQFKSGLWAYPRAFRFIWANKLAKYLLLPVVFNILVVVALVFSGIGVGDWINGIIERSVENMNGWIKAAMVAIQIVLPIVFFALFVFLGGTIVNVLMSPIHTLLSEKTETVLTGKTFPSDVRQFFKDLGRAFLVALRNTAKQLFLTALCLLLNLVPVVGCVVSLVLIFIINAYYFGSGFMDYTYERWRLSAGESRKRTFGLKGVAFANGAIYSLPLYLVFGSFIAAFIGGVSTVAATISQIELEGQVEKTDK